MRKAYREKDCLNMLSKEALVEAIAEYSAQNLGHLFTLDKKQIANVLEALSWYCTQEGIKAVPQVHDNTLLRMVQFANDDVAHRIETWGL